MSSIKEILNRTEQTLETAKQGYEDLVASNKSRRFLGLRNLIVFGRSVTFVLQNLKSTVGEEKFSSWYKEHQDSLKDDVVMKYFVKLRNELEKQGKLPVSTSVKVNYFSTDMINKYKKPKGTVGFFIGDQSGGSGFEVQLPDGTKEKYYVDLPTDVAEVKQYFNDLPVPEHDELRDKNIEDLCLYFLKNLESILFDAKKVFLKQEAEEKKSPPYMRLIK